MADVRAEICAPGNFFHSPSTATNWHTHHPHAALVPLGDDFETNRQALTALGWTAN